MRPSNARGILCEAYLKNLKWPEQAWIVLDIFSLDDIGCNNSFALNGLITLKQTNLTHIMYTSGSLQTTNTDHQLWKATDGLNSCYPASFGIDIYQQVKGKQVLVSNYDPDNNSLSAVRISGNVPSDLPPQFVPTPFITLYYIGILFCFLVVTTTMILYFHFRNQPEIKATSVPLNVLIFIGCYLLLFYLFLLNSTILPSYHKRSSSFRNFVCIFRVWIHGLGYLIALILSTLLVKMLRVYRIFNCHGKLSNYTCSNTALSFYALMFTAPNGLICLVWSTSDQYISKVFFSVKNGHLFVTEQCVSKHTIEWLLGLLVYLALISILLIIVAILTRKIKHENFKDTKKISALSFFVVLTLSFTLSYWYITRIIQANVVLVHAVLQIGHYFIILECQGFIFAPKLYPILKKYIKRHTLYQLCHK